MWLAPLHRNNLNCQGRQAHPQRAQLFLGTAGLQEIRRMVRIFMSALLSTPIATMASSRSWVTATTGCGWSQTWNSTPAQRVACKQYAVEFSSFPPVRGRAWD